MEARTEAGAAATLPWRVASRLAEWLGFAALLFVTRFLMRGHLIPQTDQECHIGGIAIDVLSHGIRFPLLTYAPNEYDNGSFFSGLLVAGSFSLLGRNALALKLVTHLISAAGAVATLSLLRGCLAELKLTERRQRWLATAILVVGLALAPRIVTLASMYAVGNHAEGSAIDTILLALFAARCRRRSATAIAGFWTLVALALYLNKGTFLVIPVLAVAEAVLARGRLVPMAAAAGGFLLGAMPELLVVSQRHGMGWLTMASKAQRNSSTFPRPFIESILTFADFRPELMITWALLLFAGVLLFLRTLRARHANPSDATTRPPITLGIVVGVTWLHVIALSVMAQGGFDAYVIYGYPTLLTLLALASTVAYAAADKPGHAARGRAVAVAGVLLAVALHRPDAAHFDVGRVDRLWRDQTSPVCSWRFAEGFEREQLYGLAPPGESREQHALRRCRLLSEEGQRLDCVGGIARERHWRRGATVESGWQLDMSEAEQQAYAYHYGTHRGGDTEACGDLVDANLVAQCRGAVQLECLVFGDAATRYMHGQGIRAPHCELPEPPMDGYWAAMRRSLLASHDVAGPNLLSASGDSDLKACRAVFDACF